MDPIDNHRERATGVLQWIRTHPVRLLAGLTLATVAISMGTVSYTHIDALTLALGGSRLAGHLMPIGVDGQIVMGSIVLLTTSGRQAWWGWLGIGLGLAESLYANWEAGIADGPHAAAWSTVAGLSFAVASFSFERWLKAQVAGVAGVASPAVRADGEASGAQHSNPCPHHVGGTAEEAVVQRFLHERDCLRGSPSQRALSASFGLSRPRVAELVAPHLPKAPEPVLNGAGPGA